MQENTNKKPNQSTKVIIRAKDHLGLSSNTLCSSSTSPVNAVTKPSVQIPFSPLPLPSPSNPLSPSSVVDGGGGSAVNELNNGGDLGDGFPLNEYLSFLNEQTPQNDVQFGGGGEDEVLESIGFRPCQYYARGFCKNGDSCKFAHVGFPSNGQ
ncbi:hypothetical protein ACFE04_018756 [Oxalis oulophora]